MPRHTRQVVDNLAQCLGPLAAFLWSLGGRRSAARPATPSRSRFAPTFLGIGVAGYVAGQSIWTYYELVLHRATPFPSWADAGYLSAYPFLFLGVLGLPACPLPLAARLRALMDSIMVMLALVTFSWYYVLGPTLLQSTGTWVAKALGTAYPLSDLVLLGCVLIVFFRSGGTALRSVVLPLCLGLASIIVIDTVFCYQTLHDIYETGRPVDIAWPLGYGLVAVAARAARRLEAAAPAADPSISPHIAPLRFQKGDVLRRLSGLLPSLLPYSVVPAVGGLVWHTVKTHGDEGLEPGVYVGVALLIVFLLARQFFTLLENQGLAGQLRTFNANLEHTVTARTEELAVRTKQLAALQCLTAAVCKTLDAERVLAVAARHAPQVMEADGALVWLLESTFAEKAGAVHDISTFFQFGLEPYPQALSRLCVAPDWDETSPVAVYRSDAPDGYCLRAPLRWQEQTLGWVGVFRRDRAFRDDETTLLQSVGLQVGTALENAHRYHAAREAADRDSVTGLLNHRAIHQYLDGALETAARRDLPLAIIMADLDNFKLFNDTYGHPTGDQVLQQITRILTEECDDAVQVARYGGDEFLLALPPGGGPEQALALAQRLRDRLAQETFQQSASERTIPLGLSFGVAAFPRDSQNRHDLLDTADANLYAAKNSDERIVGLSEMQRTNRELRVHNSFRVLDAMVTAVDNKDRYTRRHSEDVTAYALWIAEELGLSQEECRSLRVAGLLHDVGKIGVPDEILRKPGRLTLEEYDTLKQHPSLGALIIAGVPGMRDVLGAVRHHHERWDGGGYPDNLRGQAIPQEARILAVADAVSAMTTDRPYRKGMEWEIALAEVRQGSGTQFDPALAAAFLRAAQTRQGRQSEGEAAILQAV